MEAQRTVKHTKFIVSMSGMTILAVAAFTGAFDGELGFSISGIVAAYCGANTLISRAALGNGKAYVE